MATQTLPQAGSKPAAGRRILGWQWAVIAGVGLLLLLAVGAWAAKSMDDSTRIQPQVQVGDLPVGGLKRPDAAQAIQQHFAGVLDTPVELRFGNRTWTYAARDL